MTIDDVVRYFGNIIKPIKSLFGFYLLMYLIPVSIPYHIVIQIWDKLCTHNNNVNFDVAITILACIVIIILWTTFFLIYFTRERTRNPKLYGIGFVLGVPETTETADSVKAEGRQD